MIWKRCRFNDTLRGESSGQTIPEQMTIAFVKTYMRHQGHFYEHGISLIPPWISNHMPSKEYDAITYPLPNFNGFTVEV